MTEKQENGELELRKITLSDIESNPWQPRTAAPTDDELADLLNSIRATGQQTPTRVRPHPTKPGKYQIADGAMRRAVLAKLGKKTMLAVIEPLTDRQMKILALAQNIFIRLPDKDKRTAVYKLWESEFKTDEPSAKGGKRDAEFTGVREMERATGMDKMTIIGHLQAYVVWERLSGSQTTKAEKTALKNVSSRDLAAVAPIAKETPKAAVELLKARQKTNDEAPVLTAQKLRDVVAKQVAAAPAKDREAEAKRIIKAREEAREEQRKRAEALEVASKKAAESRAKREAETRPQRLEKEEREREERMRAQIMTRQKIAQQTVSAYSRAVDVVAQAITAYEYVSRANYLRPALQYDEFAKVISERRKDAQALAKKFSELVKD